MFYFIRSAQNIMKTIHVMQKNALHPYSMFLYYIPTYFIQSHDVLKTAEHIDAFEQPQLHNNKMLLNETKIEKFRRN